MGKKTIAGTIGAYLTEYSGIKPDDIRSPTPDIVSKLAFSSHNMTSAGWVKIGEARIEIDVMREDEVVNGAVAGLRAQQQKARADAEAKCTDIERQIQTLLAITHEQL